MKTISFELPESLFVAAVAQVRLQGFTSVDEYVRNLIRRDVPLPETARLETKPPMIAPGVPAPTAPKGNFMYASWRTAVISALRRYCKQHDGRDVYRHRILQEELDQMIEETQSRGRTPEMTFNRVMQELRDEELVKFVDNNGHYRYLGEI